MGSATLRRYTALLGAGIARGTLTHAEALRVLSNAFPAVHEDVHDAGLLEAVAVCEACDLHEAKVAALAALASVK